MAAREADERRGKGSTSCASVFLIYPGLVYSLMNEEFALEKKKKTKPLLHQLNTSSCETFQIKKLHTLVPSFKSHAFAIMWALHKPELLADLSSAPTATSRENPTCISLAQHHPFSSGSSTEIAAVMCAKTDSFHVK